MEGYQAAVCVHVDTQSGCFCGDEAYFALETGVDCHTAEAKMILVRLRSFNHEVEADAHQVSRCGFQEGPGKVTGIGAARRCDFYDSGSIPTSTPTGCATSGARSSSVCRRPRLILPVGADKTQATWYVHILRCACENLLIHIPQP